MYTQERHKRLRKLKNILSPDIGVNVDLLSHGSQQLSRSLNNSLPMCVKEYIESTNRFLSNYKLLCTYLYFEVSHERLFVKTLCIVFIKLCKLLWVTVWSWDYTLSEH